MAGKIGPDPKAGILRGVVLAQEGPFKDRRGKFDNVAIRRIVDQVNREPLGLVANYTHPALLDWEQLGKFVGRARNGRVDGKYARADIHLDRSAAISPKGNLAAYVMELAKSDHNAFALSLVLEPERMDGGKGEPDLWWPMKLYSVDFVAVGAATPSLFGAGYIPPIFATSKEQPAKQSARRRTREEALEQIILNNERLDREAAREAETARLRARAERALNGCGTDEESRRRRLELIERNMRLDDLIRGGRN